MFVRDEGSGERVDRLVAVRRQPLAIRPLVLARVDRRKRRGDPARLEGVGGVGPRPAGLDAELPARFEDGIPDLPVLLVGSPDLEARRPRHAVAERPDVLAVDLELTHVEELHLLERAAVELLDDRPGVRSLDLEAVELAVHRLAVRARGRAVVVANLDVVAAGLGVELQPVRPGRPPDVDELVLGEVEQDPVADHSPVGCRRHELLGRVHGEVREAVDSRVRQQLQRVRAGDEEVHHVVGLVVEHGGLAPGDLLAPPVRELRRHDGVDVRPELRVAQHLDGVPLLVEQLLEIACHVRTCDFLVLGVRADLPITRVIRSPRL